jgi:hypothetical protein
MIHLGAGARIEGVVSSACKILVPVVLRRRHREYAVATISSTATHPASVGSDIFAGHAYDASASRRCACRLGVDTYSDALREGHRVDGRLDRSAVFSPTAPTTTTVFPRRLSLYG